MKKLLLIDDDPTMNTVHEILIQKMFPEMEIKVFNSSLKGLEYLQDCIQKQVCLADFILIDINMPEINGFDLIDRVRTEMLEHIDEAKIFIITSSLHPDDQERVENDPLIIGMLPKPLTFKVIQEMIA